MRSDEAPVQASVSEDFARLTDPYRRELLAHCYRMLGSVQDAEDLVQETLLRAWRGYAGFEGRSSLRTWLYRIATRACLNELNSGHRRVLPSGLAGPGDNPKPPVDDASTEVAWVQPIPDALLDPGAGEAVGSGDFGDPAGIAVRRQSTRLALIAAMQLLPARHRAVLILRDVLGWPAVEVADLLGTSTAAVNSSLLRSRAQVARTAPAEDEIEEPAAGPGRSLLDRYAAAFARADIAGLVTLLRDDVQLEMPPKPVWFEGRDAVGRFLARHLHRPDDWRFLPVRANGQLAAAAYLRDDDGVLRAQGIHVLTVHGGAISRLSVFLDLRQFATFQLPATFPEPG